MTEALFFRGCRSQTRQIVEPSPEQWFWNDIGGSATLHACCARRF